MRTMAKPSLNMRVQLDDMTANDLMTTCPVSIRSTATVDEAIRFMADKGISGAVVIGESGRPVGVLSITDVLIHQREHQGRGPDGPPRLVHEIMTPAVFTVRPDTPAQQVSDQMVALNVHRLFVVDDAEVVVGVISALDILRHLA